MSAFSDLLLELGPTRMEAVPTRGRPWVTALEKSGFRLRTSRPIRKVPILTHEAVNGWNLWAIGEINSYDGRDGATDFCLRRFGNDLADGQAGRPAQLGGRFLIAGWSDQESKWSIWTDRCGSVHAYLCGSEGRMAVGTYSTSVYQYSRREFNWTGLAGFFRTGFFPTDTTFYNDCTVLLPASCYEFSADGNLIGQAAYWEWTHRPRLDRSENDTIAEFGEILSKAVARDVRSGRVALPLSGGLDSRTVAACLPEGAAPSSFGYGYGDDSVEIRLAGEVARAAGLPFRPHAIRPYLIERLPSVLEAVEGFQDLTQTRQADVSDWLGSEADFVIGAHWGDVLCDSLGPADVADAEAAFSVLHKKMVKRGSDWLTVNLCAPQLPGADVPELVRAELRKAYDGLAHIEDSDFRAKVVKTRQWAFRWTLPSIRAYQLGAVPRLPFLDPELLDFFCTVPTRMVQGRRLQIEFLKRHAPALARVRWQAYDADLYHYQYFDTLQLPRRTWKKLLRGLDRRPRISRNWEIQFLSGGMLERLREEILGKQSIAADLAPAAKLRALLDEFERAPTGANGYTVSMLFTFCAWARLIHRGV